MYRLARYEVSRRFERAELRLLAQLAFGIGCALALVAMMALVQLFAPLPGPFAFVFPIVVIATLYGRWTAGIAALVTSLIMIDRFIVPGSIPLAFLSTSPVGRILTSGTVGLILLILAERFRANVALHATERDREIERREMLLQELEHRTRNNFALVASLLQIQRRQSNSPEVSAALDQAISRVHTFADAYSQLDMTRAEAAQVDMLPYLSRLLDRMGEALLGDAIRVETEIAGMALPSRKAVAIGLYVNEALTNCAKYAFPEGRGTVKIALGEEAGGGWRLTVADDGVGSPPIVAPPPPSRRAGGMGAILFEALATQAGARHEVTLQEKGRRLDLVSMH